MHRAKKSFGQSFPYSIQGMILLSLMTQATLYSPLRRQWP
ncbi:unnamed protein product [Blumeria hordei]|uniref:Uncharacterized protein n=1 Tax=Blumeria hordei TaxID=2867405 RepID=A0A383UTP5_BLUHO|nr:unnamed protein product [Blumeria hordei]